MEQVTELANNIRRSLILLLILSFLSCNKEISNQKSDKIQYNWLPKTILFTDENQKVEVYFEILIDGQTKTENNFSLYSQDSNIATISKNEITSKNEGTTFVILSYNNFSSKITVVVNPNINFKEIKPDKTKIDITNWGTYTVNLSGYDSNHVEYKNIFAIWKSSNPLIATVNNNNLINIGAENGSGTLSAYVDNVSTSINISVNLPVKEPYGIKVFSFEKGDNGSFGEDYFPNNILGAPSGGEQPQSSPKELYSLGNNGSITIQFANYVINKAGCDFTVFENPVCENRDCSLLFTETAFVGVSQNGDNFIFFPAYYNKNTNTTDTPYYNPDNFQGLAGVHFVYAEPPTISAINPSVSGGDCFDLEKLGLKWAKYVKIVDTGFTSLDNNGEIIDDAGNHFACAPDKCGFDFDAVSIVHSGHETP